VRLDNNSAQIREMVKELIEIDTRWGQEAYGAEREDLQLARRIFAESERPFTALRAAWKSGASLPAVAAPVLMWGLEHADESGT